MQSNREELVERMAASPSRRRINGDIPRLFPRSFIETGRIVQAIYQPAFCFVAQGGKQVLLGEEVFLVRSRTLLNLHG